MKRTTNRTLKVITSGSINQDEYLQSGLYQHVLRVCVHACMYLCMFVCAYACFDVVLFVLPGMVPVGESLFFSFRVDPDGTEPVVIQLDSTPPLSATATSSSSANFGGELLCFAFFIMSVSCFIFVVAAFVVVGRVSVRLLENGPRQTDG
jgi:hypothetical protein